MRSKSSEHNVYINLGASNHTLVERSVNDFYATPPLAVQHLLEVEKFNDWVWEPACGMNHITNELRKNDYMVKCSDIVKMVEDNSIEIIDFLGYQGEWKGDIITNPPYKYATEFVYKALECVKEGSKVAMFLKIQFLEGKKRYELLKKFPPKTIYVASQRYGCSPDGKFNSDGNTGSAICYCWFIWEKGFTGDPTLKWINY
jgi:hypothetical protein